MAAAWAARSSLTRASTSYLNGSCPKFTRTVSPLLHGEDMRGEGEGDMEFRRKECTQQREPGGGGGGRRIGAWI